MDAGKGGCDEDLGNVTLEGAGDPAAKHDRTSGTKFNGARPSFLVLAWRWLLQRMTSRPRHRRRHFRRRGLGQVRRWGPDPAIDLDDVLQEAERRVARQEATGKVIKHRDAYLKRARTSAKIDLLRKSSFRPLPLQDSDAACRNSFQEEVETRDLLNYLMTKLDDEAAHVVLLRWQGYTGVEIARSLGVSTATVSRILGRAKRVITQLAIDEPC